MSTSILLIVVDVGQESTLYNHVFRSYLVLYHKRLAGDDALRARMPFRSQQLTGTFKTILSFATYHIMHVLVF